MKLTDFAPGMEAVFDEQTRLSELDPAATAQYWAVGADDVHSIEEGYYTGAGITKARSHHRREGE